MIAARQIAFGGSAKRWENPYPTDGLTLHFDGVWNAGGGKHDNDFLGCKDLSGNGFDIEAKSVGENYVNLSNRPKLTYPELLSVLGGEHFTIQMLSVFGTSASSYYVSMMVIDPPAQYVDFRNYTYGTNVNINTGFRYLFGNQNLFLSFPRTTDNIWTTRLSLIRNGGNCEVVYTASDGREKRFTKTVTQPTSLPTSLIFNRTGDFRVHYVRIYNRVLGDDELAYIDEIDKARFNI